MLSMINLTKRFQTESVETLALRDFSVDVKEGEFVAVTGPSGSGKSTFLNIAGLLDEFESGSYFLDGIDVRQLCDDDRSTVRNEKIGFIFQAFNLIPDLNIRQNVDVPLRYRGFGVHERLRRIEQALEKVGLTARASHYPAQLSGGQQQRAAIARALAGNPRVLLADEPTGNLDTDMARGVMRLIETLNSEGATVIMVTHDAELAKHAHREIHILDGRTVDLVVRNSTVA
jgi:putative ABC transport system ATP-binding protein